MRFRTIVLLGSWTLLLGACAAVTSGAYFPTENIAAVQIGASESEVIELLGQPYITESYTGGKKLIWVYSTREADQSFVVTIEDDTIRSFSSYRDSGF